ncbi:unnamed protein product [Sympodiomycopsis kandeliae]
MPSDANRSPSDRDSRSPSPQAAQGNNRESADPPSSTHLDSVAREKVLASQLRRRAMASRTRRPSNGEHDREPSRTPPTSSSESSPPPAHRTSSSTRRKRSRSRSRSRSPSPTYSERKLARRQDASRERDRRRRRSGRDLDEDDVNDIHRSSSRSNRSPGERNREIFIRGSGGRGSSNQPDGEHVHADDDDDDDARSMKSMRSNRSYARSGSIRADSRDPDDHASRRRRQDRDRDRDRHRRRRSARQDSRDYDGYQRGPPPSSRDRHLEYDSYSPAYGQRDPYERDRGYGDRRRGYSPLPVPPRTPTPERDDYELRSIFCSQLAARLTQRDLGEFFEEKLGEDTVKDVRIVTDRNTGRSKGIGYVELVSEAMVERAIQLSGEKIYGIPILVQKTEAARNRGEGASTAQAPIRPNSDQAANGLPGAASNLPLPPHLTGAEGNAMHLQMFSNLTGGGGARAKVNDPAARLYVGSLHFNLTDADVRSVFEPFGDIEDVDLHREPTGKSKGFAFVQFKTAAIAEQAIAHMNGFELAGRKIRVGHTKGSDGGSRAGTGLTSTGGSQSSFNNTNNPSSGDTATLTSAFDEGGGGGLNAHSRANLMQMLARGDSNSTTSSSIIAEPVRPATIPQATSRAVLLKNMFNPEEETEADWDTDLSEDVKGECSSKYGNVELCHVEKDSSVGEIYLRFTDLDGAARAITGLNGRFFGGRKVSAEYISESFLTAKLG